jgi:putative ABC transport system permease protein
MLQDIRYALRTFRKSPGFAAVAVIAIALGVGPNSAIFSIVNAVLLRPLPYKDPDRVVMLWENSKARGFDQLPVSGPTFMDWKRECRSFEDMAPAFTIPEYGFNVTAGGEPERAQGGQAAANMFSVLGVKPVLGRYFLPEEDRPGGDPVVLISHSFWRRRFGGARDVAGKSVGLDGRSATIVGVLPPEVEALGRVDVWLPIAQDLALQRRDHHNYGIVARLKPGATVRQAQAELDTIARRLERDFPESNAGIGALVIPMSEVVAGRIRPALMVMLAAVGFLLLIACANVASLLLARAASRQREIAVRAAVGASRWRVIRQLLTESVLLASAGGALGVLLAAWSVRALRSQLPDVIPRLKDMGVDANVLLFTLAISALTGVLFGLAPALRASRTDLNETLKEGGGRGTPGDASQRARSVLLVAEVALAVVLLAGAGLMVRSFLHVISVDPGFRASNVLTMQLTMPDSKYPHRRQRADFAREALQRIGALPGVRSAAVVSYLPMRGGLINLRVSVMPFQVDGEPPAPVGQEPTADYRAITPGFLQTMGIPLRAGRNFNEHDKEGRSPVVMINETMARRYSPNANPVGRRLRLPPFEKDVREIVGVVADVKLQGLEGKVEPAIFVPLEQGTPRQFSIVVSALSNAAGLSGPVRREIQAIDSEQAVADVRTMEEVMSDSLLVRRLSVWMLGIFGALALMLATVGIYGLTSYGVSRRRREIGLRMALGAQPGNVLRLVVARGLAVVLIGVALGVPAAFALARLMQGLLFGVTSTDAVVFLAVPLALAAAAALASYIPARRAMRIDPIIALRYE